MYSIEVMSYIQALQYVYNHSGERDDKKYAIISIQEYTNGYGLGLEFKQGGNCLDALNIEFSDIGPSTPLGIHTENELKVMTKEDAVKIHNFVENLSEDVEKLIIHCYAGASRSVAVAAAISKVKFGDDRIYFKDGCPNMHVYNMVLEAYGLSNKYEEK